MINTSNAGNLQISSSNRDINFSVLTNDFITAKITGNATVGGKVYHSWEVATPVAGSEQTLQSDRALGYGTTTQSPAVTLDNTVLPSGTFVLLRFRTVHPTYGSIFDAFTSGAGSTSTTVITPSVGTIAEWRGEFYLGGLKVYDFANNWYFAFLNTLGTHGWRFYNNSSVLSVPPSWFMYIGSNVTLVPQQSVTARATSVDVVLPCTYSNGYAVWNGYQVANDPLQLLKSRSSSSPGSAYATSIRLNSGYTSSTGWIVTNCATDPYTV